MAVMKRQYVVTEYFDDESPCIYAFLQSGFPNKVIMITEDPYFGTEMETISKRRHQELINKLEEKVENGQEN